MKRGSQLLFISFILFLLICFLFLYLWDPYTGNFVKIQKGFPFQYTQQDISDPATISSSVDHISFILDIVIYICLAIIFGSIILKFTKK